MKYFMFYGLQSVNRCLHAAVISPVLHRCFCPRKDDDMVIFQRTCVCPNSVMTSFPVDHYLSCSGLVNIKHRLRQTWL